MSSHDPNEEAALFTRVYSPALSLNPPNSSPERYDKSLTYFNSIDWTRDLLSRENTYTYLPPCRNSGQDIREQLFSSTFNSDDTIPYLIGTFQATDAEVKDPESPITKISLLVYLGSGLSGVPMNLHGGVTMALLDEAMGQAIEVNSALNKASFSPSCVTGTLETKFRRLIQIGTVVRAEATLERTEGRKTFVSCVVTDEDGNVLAEGKSIWLCLKARM